jgi:hypothetical protein
MHTRSRCCSRRHTPQRRLVNIGQSLVAAAHTPSVHTLPAAQMAPQLPQFAAEIDVSTQTPWQKTCAPGQVPPSGTPASGTPDSGSPASGASARGPAVLPEK